MPSFTKLAIKKSFLKLLNEKPFAKITVKDIVEDCGVNRNSFYYHFQDIPTLLEEVIIGEANDIIDSLPEKYALGEGIETVLKYVVINKKAVRNIWSSSTREFYEQHLMRICEHVISHYMISRNDELPLTEEESMLLLSFLKCEIFGQIIDWLTQNMSYDIVEHAHKLTQFFSGSVEFILLKRNEG